MNTTSGREKTWIKIMWLGVAAAVCVTVIFGVIYIRQENQKKKHSTANSVGDTIVALNEISVLLSEETANGQTSAGISSNNMEADSILTARDKLQELQDSLRNQEKIAVSDTSKIIGCAYLVTMGILILLFFVIYLLILRPFDQLETFADTLAAGDLDTELRYHRINMFGRFTWAFDHMRYEILRARQSEKDAIENNKTVIATLSHDIKTPIASIRAYAEGLEENMDSSSERRSRYTEVIMRKCDEVTKITNDMFLHSLHDLNKLIIKKEEVSIHQVLTDTIDAMQGSKEDIHIIGDIKECVLPHADTGRIAQVLENIISNARKYAKDTSIDIRTEESEEIYRISIRDHGPGIPPEDIPFIWDKFYRGSNHGDEPGSGLGLFIVKYVMEQMGGHASLSNHIDGGLEVILEFDK